MLDALLLVTSIVTLEITSEGELYWPVSMDRETVACVLSVEIPPMGKCDGDTIDVRVSGYAALPFGSDLRYTFEFPTNTGTDSNKFIGTPEREQCVLTTRKSPPSVTITSRGVPVDIRGRMIVKLVLFPKISVFRNLIESSYMVQKSMPEVREKMTRERLEAERWKDPVLWKILDIFFG